MTLKDINVHGVGQLDTPYITFYKMAVVTMYQSCIFSVFGYEYYDS